MIMKNIIFSSPFHGKRYVRLPEIRKNLLFILFMLMLFAGITVGALCGRTADKQLMEDLDIIFLTNFKVRCSQGVLDAFVASFASAFIFILVIFLLGLSVWGGFISAAVPFIKGYGYGLATGYLYGTYGLTGILYNILIILPGAFLCSAVIAAAAQEAFRSSTKIISIFRKTAVSDDPNIQMKKYMLSMLWLLFIAAVSSAIDMLFSLMFSWLFNFS